MNRRVIAAAVGGLAAAASVGTALALPSQPSARSGTISFVAVQTVNHNFKGYSVSGDKDVRNGHVIGTDTLQCKAASNGNSADCHVAASYKRGQIYGTFTLSFKDGSLSGKVTGGTGVYQGAVGTIKGHAVTKTKEKVTVNYQTP